MMTRTSRGHTGRPLRADAFDTACYLMIAMSAVVRVFVPLVAPEQLVVAVAGPAALWSAGFAIFAVRYWPVLSSARIDGLPG